MAAPQDTITAQPEHATASVPAPAPAPATGAAAPIATSAPRQNSAIDQQDVDDWKNRLNDVLSRIGPVIKSKSPEGSQSWHTGFFDCFNPLDTCMVTWCLPCITFGRTHHRVRKNGNLEGYEPINTSCLLLCGAGCVGLAWLPIAMQRMNIREKYNLQGSCMQDLFTSVCCHCCSMIQQDKEAEHREQLLRAQGVQQQYQANGNGMQYPAMKETSAMQAPTVQTPTIQAPTMESSTKEAPVPHA